jgi:hypothetical protein
VYSAHAKVGYPLSFFPTFLASVLIVTLFNLRIVVVISSKF